MKRIFTIAIVAVIILSLGNASMVHAGHHGGKNGAATGWAILGGLLFVGAFTAIINKVTAPPQQPAYAQQEYPEQQLDPAHYVVRETKDVLGKVEVLVGSPNGKGPAQIQGQKCFPNGVLFPYGARLFDYNNREVGYVPRGGTYKPGECLYD